MANDVKNRVTDWCSAADDLELVETRDNADSDVSLRLRAGTDALDVDAVVASGGDRLILRHSPPSTSVVDDDDALSRFVESRPGSLSAWVVTEGGYRNLVLQAWVYLDGLNQQTFMTAVAELTRSRRAFDRLAGNARPLESAPATAATATATAPSAEAVPMGAEPAAIPTPESAPAAAPEPAPAAPAEPEPVAVAPAPQPTADTAPQAFSAPAPSPAWSPQPAPQPAYAAQPAPAPAPAAGGGGGWTPTHKVPAQGMQAWAAPDPSGAVVANLGGNLPVQVTETRGAWANVLCSNGWAGWVDARLLTPGA
jgi:hypothetical protein